jgi:hypothetical protein
LPYAALRRRSRRRMGRTLGFRGTRCRRRLSCPGLPYAALPQRRAVPYSPRWARSARHHALGMRFRMDGAARYVDAFSCHIGPRPARAQPF